MKNLTLILASFAFLNSWANDLFIIQTPQKPVIIKPKPQLISESSLESIVRASKFAEKLMKADEGGWSGNGGGSRDESDNIWFIGDSSIKYCFSKDSQFPLSGIELSELISSSITEWMKFFKDYNLVDNDLAGGYTRERMNSFQFHDSQNRKLTTEFIYTNDCSEARLQFLFGIENKVISNYKKYATDHPYGLAVRQKYDHKNYAHSGIIWIDNFTKDKKEIKHMLLHELGHIFGMKHDSVPVMDEEMIKFLGKKKEFRSQFIGKIESDAWTYGLKVNHPIVMTSTKGRKPRRRRNSQSFRVNRFCDNIPSYSSNRKIPNKILKGLNLNKRDCHKLTLTYVDKIKNNKKVKYKFILELEELISKQKIVFNGAFKPSKGNRPKIEGPGVVTRLINNNSKKKKNIFKKLTLEKAPNMIPLTGSFTLGSEDFAAKMTSHKGLVIELFIPSAKSWWTFKTHYNQN